MNKAQEAYIRANFGQKSVKELVEDTEAKLADVKKFIKTLNVAVTVTPKETPKNFFHTADDKIVAMTSTQSAKDDEMNHVKNVKKPIPPHVFVMDPNKPIR